MICLSFQSLKSEVVSHQVEVDHFTDLAQALLQTSSEQKLTTYVSHATTRYNTLLTAVKVSAVMYQGQGQVVAMTSTLISCPDLEM